MVDATSGIDQDQVLEELLGKVKSSKTTEKSGINPFKTPESFNVHHSVINSPNNTTQQQNPFRKSTGIKRATPKQVSHKKFTILKSISPFQGLPLDIDN